LFSFAAIRCERSILRCKNLNFKAQSSYRNSAPHTATPFLLQKASITQITKLISVGATNYIYTKLAVFMSSKTSKFLVGWVFRADSQGNPLFGPLIHTARPVFCKNRKIKQIYYPIGLSIGAANIYRRLVGEPETQHPAQISEIDIAVRRSDVPRNRKVPAADGETENAVAGAATAKQKGGLPGQMMDGGRQRA